MLTLVSHAVVVSLVLVSIGFFPPYNNMLVKGGKSKTERECLCHTCVNWFVGC